MLYTPKRCNECGEEIEPATQGTLIRHRFCENCEQDFKWQKFLPLIWLSLGLVGIIYGFGSYLKKPDKPVNLLANSTTAAASNKNQNLPNRSNSQVLGDSNVQVIAQKADANNANLSANSPISNAAPVAKTVAVKQNSAENGQNPATEPIYICGAQTKKGTACLRRVKKDWKAVSVYYFDASFIINARHSH